MSGPDPLVGKTLADRFEILERIGEGGTGVVYRAKQLSVDRTIAIKVLGAHVSTDPSWVKRFHNEARAASRLDHPNTVRLIDFGQTKEGLLFIAMEFLHGKSLRQEIDRVGRLPPNRVLRIMSQICASLSEAHNQGIIHRDIKPDNVYLADMKGAGDYVKVLDFSVAKLDAPDAQVTRAGGILPTLSISSRSAWPCKSSIAMNNPSFACPKSMSCTVFGWWSFAAARASLWKRLTHDGSDETWAPSTLIAMSRSTVICFALYTTPVPPSPMRSRISKRSARTFPTSGSLAIGCCSPVGQV